MKTSMITGTVLSIALLGSAAVQAANVLPEEPYANFAVEQSVTDQGSTADYATTSQPEGLFWGDGFDTQK